VKAPTVVQVETTSFCNANCIFCVHGKMKKYLTMEDSVYDKILREIAGWEDQPKCFIPMLTGEPFSDANILHRIARARRDLPNTEILLFTNGSLILEADIEAMAKIRGLRVFYSLNALCPETRKAMMGLDDYFRAFSTYFKMLNAGIETIASMVDHPNIPEAEKHSFSSSIGVMFQYQNWAGKLYNGAKRPKMGCSRAQGHMTILADGTANLCCFDPMGEMAFGNVREQTLLDIWKSKERQYVSTCHANGEGQLIEYCKNCTEPYSDKEVL